MKAAYLAKEKFKSVDISSDWRGAGNRARCCRGKRWQLFVNHHPLPSFWYFSSGLTCPLCSTISTVFPSCYGWKLFRALSQHLPAGRFDQQWSPTCPSQDSALKRWPPERFCLGVSSFWRIAHQATLWPLQQETEKSSFKKSKIKLYNQTSLKYEIVKIRRNPLNKRLWARQF